MLNLYSVMKNDSGLTLIETLLAMAMLIVLVTAFTGAFVVGLQGEVDVDQHQAAGALAENIMEHLGDVDEEDDLSDVFENTPYEEEPLGNFFSNYGDEIDLSTSAQDFYDNQNIADNGSYIDVKEAENDVPDTLYNVEVYIEWTDRGENRDFTLETRIHYED